MARHRTQLSLDEEHYQALTELAENRRRSIPEVVQELIDLGLQQVQDRKDRGQRALAGLSSLRHTLEARIGIDPSDPIAEVREARERQRDEVLRSSECR
jgi:predicted DNA-binding ribbon-helix-helix protein